MGCEICHYQAAGQGDGWNHCRRLSVCKCMYVCVNDKVLKSCIFIEFLSDPASRKLVSRMMSSSVQNFVNYMSIA